MGRVVHFEIEGNDLEALKTFYSEVFGWSFEDYSEYTKTPYWGVITGKDEQAGINGGLMPRKGTVAAAGTSPRAFVCTIVVDDYDASARKIHAAGGKEVEAKAALPGMAWQGYYADPEGNVFGLHQPDENAR